MSDCENIEFDERFLELNNWQIEQQRKLKLFQEAQRKLLDSEHEKLLNNLKTQTFEHKHGLKEDEVMLTTESESDRKINIGYQNHIINYDSDAIKLKDPKISLQSRSQFSLSEKSGDFLDDNKIEYEENEPSKPRKFLKRGEGMARFRMTVDDFKTPPNIYREKKIKTYLNQKPDFNKRKHIAKSVNNGVKRKNTHPCKSKSVPINIYVNEDKAKKISPAIKNSCETKAAKTCSKNKDLPVTKAPVRTLTLKPILPSNCTRSLADRTNGNNGLTDKSIIDKEIKKDEKELQMFEMLEGKIDEGSLSPNSSLVARFMEESFISTPTKPVNNDCDGDFAHSYLESLREIQRRYLTSEQIDRIKDSTEEISNEASHNSDNIKSDEKVSESYNSSSTGPDIILNEKINENPDEDFEEPKLAVSSSSEDEQECCLRLKERDSPLPLLKSSKANKTVLQEYIANFKKLKKDFQECCPSDNDEVISEKNSLDNINEQVLSQREIAIKLQRKALQDNVKTLLNWEGQVRKRQPKKFVKKIREKSLKPEKAKNIEKSDGDKIVINNELIKERMVELEREIEIFEKENKILFQLQRDCDAEKARLEREKKEFEKHMAQEKEKFEARINEEQKKLQRDKNVFEKYCKQVRNQPNKKEREEIANLKKEVEKLTESIMTKEARWGASQARLRNQVKTLERENHDLKVEVEKLKKQNAKKVTFHNEKQLNTKVIHAINSELGKLKPHLMKTGSTKQKYQSQTARIDSNVQRPMRRIKSVPDLKNHSSKDDDDDSGEVFENSPTESNRSENKLIHIAKESVKADTSRSSRSSGSEMEKSADSGGTGVTSSKNRGSAMDCNADPEECFDDDGSNKEKDAMEAVLREVFFDRGDEDRTNVTIAEIKKRLGKLNLLNHSDPYGNGRSRSRSISNDPTECSSEETSESDETSPEEAIPMSADIGLNTNKLPEERPKFMWSNATWTTCSSQTKVDGDGVREKKYEDGKKEIFYPNGNIKKISADKRIVKMLYYNGDLKETDVVEGSEKYYYSETKTWHTTYRDGLEVLEFPNGQTERRHPDGSTEILFPNGCVRYCDSSGKDEWRFPDGTVIKTDKDGHKVLLLPNGQKEIHTKQYKKREYPDGTVKLLYADGTQETRYATGRVRLKDKDGNLVMDSGGFG